MQDHMKLLGFKVRDAVTGFEGVVESISFDLYGCVQAIVRPVFEKEKAEESLKGHWFDTKRLVSTSESPVMAIPRFDAAVPCGTSKPAYTSKPTR